MQKSSAASEQKQQMDGGAQQSHNEATKELCPPAAGCCSISPPSSARRRWMLLTNKVMKTKPKEPELEDSTGFKSFGFFALAAFGERSSSGSWYQLISPTKDVHLELHFLSADGTKLKDLVGYDNTGNVRLWPAEECLAQYLLLNDSICRGKRVLELGAGMTGLAGLMALTSGAQSVCLTDGNERSVENLRMIVERNGLEKKVGCAVLDWAEGRLAETFDLIICADCIFFTSSHEALLGCIHDHLQQGGVAYLMAPSRRGTAMQFLNRAFVQRAKWKSVQIAFRFQKEIERRIKMFENQPIYEADLHTPILFVLEK